MTWAFVLEAVDECTRVLSCAPAQHAGIRFYGLPPSIGMPFIRFGHFVMQRRQLLGIASRAESRHPTGNHTTRSEAA